MREFEIERQFQIKIDIIKINSSSLKFNMLRTNNTTDVILCIRNYLSIKAYKTMNSSK